MKKLAHLFSNFCRLFQYTVNTSDSTQQGINYNVFRRKQSQPNRDKTAPFCLDNTGLFISPSGISELDCETTKTDMAERSISIGRESLQVFFLY